VGIKSYLGFDIESPLLENRDSIITNLRVTNRRNQRRGEYLPDNIPSGKSRVNGKYQFGAREQKEGSERM
jgi:hypothetical protein